MKQLTIYTATGRESAKKASLPEEIFGQEMNENLLAQAYYVYQAHAHTGSHKTKTRGEVIGTTAKWYRQKGTGRARHGAKTAPIFRGGGIAHGPTGLKRNLKLPQNLAQRALKMIIARRLMDKKLIIFDPTNLDGKTKTFAKILDKFGWDGNKVLILHAKESQLIRSARNVAGVILVSANQVNAYQIINCQNIILTPNGLELLKERLSK